MQYQPQQTRNNPKQQQQHNPYGKGQTSDSNSQANHGQEFAMTSFCFLMNWYDSVLQSLNYNMDVKVKQKLQRNDAEEGAQLYSWNINTIEQDTRQIVQNQALQKTLLSNGRQLTELQYLFPSRENQSVIDYFFNSYAPSRTFLTRPPLYQNIEDLFEQNQNVRYSISILMELYTRTPSNSLGLADKHVIQYLQAAILSNLDPANVWLLCQNDEVLLCMIFALEFCVVRETLSFTYRFQIMPQLRRLGMLYLSLRPPYLAPLDRLDKIHSHWILTEVSCEITPEQIAPPLYVIMNNQYSFETFEEDTKTEPITGTSKQMLRMIAVTTQLSACSMLNNGSLIDDLKIAAQRSISKIGLTPFDNFQSTLEQPSCLERIAAANFAGLQIYFLRRALKKPVSSSEVISYMNKLRGLLKRESIPTSGPSFRAVYPLFALFVFCVTLQKEDILAEELIRDLRMVRNFENVKNVLDGIEKIGYNVSDWEDIPKKLDHQGLRFS